MLFDHLQCLWHYPSVTSGRPTVRPATASPHYREVRLVVFRAHCVRMHVPARCGTKACALVHTIRNVEVVHWISQHRRTASCISQILLPTTNRSGSADLDAEQVENLEGWQWNFA